MENEPPPPPRNTGPHVLPTPRQSGQHPVPRTPSGLHPQHGVRAAQAGRHVLTEKPMAISLAGADDLVRACDAAAVHLFVVKQNRLNPAIQLLKRAVDKERFGRIYMANTTVRWTRPQEYYDQQSWRGTWEFDGGAMMNQASHYVDLMQWLVGPVESVIAKTATQARQIEAEDSGAAVLKFRSGALGVIEVSVLTYPRNIEGSITILGEKGSVKIGGTAVVARLFQLTQPALLQLRWFARWYPRWKTWKEAVLADIRHSAAWRAGQAIKRSVKAWLRAWRGQ